MKLKVATTVNGRRHEHEVEPRLLLVHHLRDNLGLTGTHIGCDTSQCGACTILVDGKAVKSCTMFAVQAEGHELTTIEGLADGDTLHPIQQAFWDEHGLQCGYCTPGFIMAAKYLLDTNPNRREDPRLVAGGGRYMDDFKRPNTTYAAFIRSPYAHAKIRMIDPTEAKKAPGVVAVFTAQDFEGVLMGPAPVAPAFVAEKHTVP